MIRTWRNKKKIPTPKLRWKKLHWQLGNYTQGTYRKPSEQLFFDRRPLSYPDLTEYMKTY